MSRDPWRDDPDRTTRRESPPLAGPAADVVGPCAACLTAHGRGACSVADLAAELSARGFPRPRWPWPADMIAGALADVDRRRAALELTRADFLALTPRVRDVPAYVLAHALADMGR